MGVKISSWPIYVNVMIRVTVCVSEIKKATQFIQLYFENNVQHLNSREGIAVNAIHGTVGYG